MPKENKSKLQIEREKRGLSLRKLADDLNEKRVFEKDISFNTLGHYERGDREPKLATWEKLANYFGVPVPYLQGYEMDETETALVWDAFLQDKKYKHLLDSYNELFPEKGFFRFRALDDDEEFYKNGNLWLDTVQELEDTAVALDVDPTDIPAIRFRLANDILAPSLPKWTIASPAFKVRVWARLNAITDEQREEIRAELFPNNTAK